MKQSHKFLTLLLLLILPVQGMAAAYAPLHTLFVPDSPYRPPRG